jgi:hypothetical protein
LLIKYQLKRKREKSSMKEITLKICTNCKEDKKLVGLQVVPTDIKQLYTDWEQLNENANFNYNGHKHFLPKNVIDFLTENATDND